VNYLTPWQCYSKFVEIFLPNLHFSCKESASNWIDFGSQMSESPKSTSINKFCVGFTAEVDNQRNCLVMCLDQMAVFAITSVVRSRFQLRDFLPSFFKYSHDISKSLFMNELLVAACC